jgi:hypothetical protein
MELDNFRYNLTALKKCDQVWDEMNPVLGGRLCGKCDKKIVDFSKMTHSEIAFYMADRNEPVCGFYLRDQLPQFAKNKYTLPATLGLSTILTTSTIFGQTNTITKPETYQTDNTKIIDAAIISKIENEKPTDTIFIKGKIQSIDTTTKKVEPVGFVSIIIKGTKIGVAANKNGEFILRFHPTNDSGTLSLILGSISYKSKQVDIEYKDQPQIDLGIITMQKDDNIIEYYVIVKKRTKLGKLWKKIKKFFRGK